MRRYRFRFVDCDRVVEEQELLIGTEAEWEASPEASAPDSWSVIIDRNVPPDDSARVLVLHVPIGHPCPADPTPAPSGSGMFEAP